MKWIGLGIIAYAIALAGFPPMFLVLIPIAAFMARDQ